MILATVGTQLPFPRLIDTLERLARRHGLHIVAQTCADPVAGRTIEQHRLIPPERFAALASQARLIVGHAGIGTIFTGTRAAKPIIVIPRRAALGEHRSDHQLATAAALEDYPGIYVAWNEAALERLIMTPGLAPARLAPSTARQALVSEVAAFVRCPEPALD